MEREQGRDLKAAYRRGDVLGIPEDPLVPEILPQNQEMNAFPFAASPDARSHNLSLHFPKPHTLGFVEADFNPLGRARLLPLMGAE